MAAAPTLEDMRRERKGLPPKLAKLMTYLVNHLFHLDLTASLAWSKAGINDHTLSAAFRDATGLTLGKYIELRRLEVAERMMRIAPDVELARISMAVGYRYHGTFVKTYKRWLRETPARARRKPNPPEMDLLRLRRYVRGELDADAVWRVHEIGVRLYPFLESRLRERYGQAGGEPRTEVDGDRLVRWSAVGVWEELRALPFEEQKRRLRRIRFHSTALFDLLREKSREEGRRDRRRGIEVAELALVSLEGCEDIFGERIHDLRALAWAWIANAHVLAHDFSEADVAFDEADLQLKLPASNDQSRLAEILSLKGTLRTFQRNYEEALDLVEQSRTIFHAIADKKGRAKSLIKRAAIMDYTGDLKNSIASLEEAMALLVEQAEPYLAYTAYGNLANLQARVGSSEAAFENLAKAKGIVAALDHPLGTYEIAYLDGFIRLCLGDLKAAEPLLQYARSGFGTADEPIWLAFVSIDLTILFAELSNLDAVVDLAGKTLPILESLRLYPETLTAVSLLSQALQTESFVPEMLLELRHRLHRDPMTQLSW